LPKKKAKRVAKTKSNKNWFIALAVIILIALFVVSILVLEQGEQNETPFQEQNESATVEISSGDICKVDLQCFSVSCKSTPTIFECINVTNQETYYKHCKAYWDVNVVQDLSSCTCIQGKCTTVR